MVDSVCKLDVGLVPVDAVVFVVALPVELMLLLPVCCAVAEPAVIRTGTKVKSVADSVAVANAGIESLPASRAEPDAAAVQIAWVLPMS